MVIVFALKSESTRRWEHQVAKERAWEHEDEIVKE